MKKLASAGMKLLEEVLLISLQFGYQPPFGLEQFWRQWPHREWGTSITGLETPPNEKFSVLFAGIRGILLRSDQPPARRFEPDW
jgi:hypothetical protein